MPSHSNSWLTNPPGPSTRLQPKARTTTDTSSGARITSRQTERQGGCMRLRMTASGAPISMHSTVTSAAIQPVRQKISR